MSDFPPDAYLFCVVDTLSGMFDIGPNLFGIAEDMGDNKLAPMKIVIVGTSRNASFCFQPTQPTTNQGTDFQLPFIP